MSYTKCRFPGHEAPVTDATRIVTITAPPGAARANAPEVVCGSCAAKLAEAYNDFDWEIRVEEYCDEEVRS